MQFNITSDYAIRCVLFLGKNRRLCSATEISAATGMNKAYALQVLRILRNAGIVRSELGNAGGYCLARDVGKLSLYDIIAPFEKTMKINKCLEDNRFCNINGPNNCCPVFSFYQGLQYIMDDYLKGATVGHLIGEEIN